MKWVFARLGESSTYAGIASVIMGAGILGHVNEAPAIAHAVEAAAPSLVSGQWYIGAGALLAGIVAAFKKG